MAQLTKLPNGCLASKLSVHPKNWKQISASAKIDWYIHYRFHDPALKYDPKYKYGFLVIFKGMNEEKDVRERRLLVMDLIEAEMRNLNAGWHPIKKQFVRPPDYNHELNPDTPFIQALKVALSKIKAVKGTLIDMGCVVNGVEKSAITLNLHQYPVSLISRKHFKQIFEQCYINNKRFSPHRHNKYKAYLSKIYKQLIQYEAVEINPLRDIQNEQYTKKERITLTIAERKLIDRTLHDNQYNFWRVINLFFHSGARETEFMKVQGKHVDLANRRIKYTVLKGPHREIWRPIKDIVYHLWEELMQKCKPEDYVFSVNLEPGSKNIRADQLGRRWNNLIKIIKKKHEIDIKATFYSLKHSNTTEVVELLNDEDAARLNGHCSTAMVRKIYDVNREERQNNRIRQVNNKFA